MTEDTIEVPVRPVGVRIEEPLYGRLLRWAKIDRRSVSQSVSVAIEEALEKRGIMDDDGLTPRRI